MRAEGPLKADPLFSSRSPFNWALRHSPAMGPVRLMIERVAPTDATVLIWGETGVGKDLVARSIHARSRRRDGPLVKVNCAALPTELLESELFGYDRGAFTGAERAKPGKFELAHGGTIFLDEIGEMPLQLQAKLLQVLQDRQFSRLGSQHDLKVDVRVIAATNKDLSRLVTLGVFREDLFYRLNVMSVHVPPLRERPEELPILVEYLFERAAEEYSSPPLPVSAETLQRLQEWRWPGNVRELENVIKRMVVLGDDRRVLAELPSSSGASAVVGVPSATTVREEQASPPARGLKEIVRDAVREAEDKTLRETLEKVHWHRLEAARRLGVSYKTLLEKMKQHGL